MTPPADRFRAQGMPSIAGGLEAYLNEVRKIPVLEKADEYELAIKAADRGDKEARDMLIWHNLRFVTKEARRYLDYGISYSDLVQEGNMGLMVAAKKFDPHRNVRFLTYAGYWVDLHIVRYIMANWRIIRFTKNTPQRKLFHHIGRLSVVDGVRSESNESIARDLDVKPEDVEEMRVLLHATADSAAQGAMNRTNRYADFEGEDPAMFEVPDDSPNVEEVIEKKIDMQMVRSAMDELSDVEFSVINDRYLVDAPLKHREIAEKHGKKGEWARKKEASALRKITASIEKTHHLHIVREAAENLPEVERDIFFERFLSNPPVEQKKLAARYGRSVAWVRQKEISAKAIVAAKIGGDVLL